MRRFTAFAVCVMAMVLAAPRTGTPETIVTRFIQFDTRSAVDITRFFAGYEKYDDPAYAPTEQSPDTQWACLDFVNRDARRASEIDFQFVYYDTLNNHAGGDDLVRTGSFSQGAEVRSEKRNGDFDETGCVHLPRHAQGISLIIAFVKSIRFADGKTWTTGGPTIPEHLDAPAPDPSASPASAHA